MSTQPLEPTPHHQTSHRAKAPDPEKTEAFVMRVLGDVSAAVTTLMSSFGDRLGLFKDLDRHGPATAAELAARTKLNERYVREWLHGMAAAGYLTWDAASNRFTLPPEHAPALCEENGAFFFGGMHQMLPSLAGQMGLLERAFHEGGGIPLAAYDDDWWTGLTRFTNGWFENHLTQSWIPGMPDVLAKLEEGGSWADVGTGRGRAPIKLAQAYPRARFDGFDIFTGNVEVATRAAAAAGVGDRVRFHLLDAAKGLPGTYDVISTFDVIHDAVDPAGILRSIRKALRPGGIFVCLDINCGDELPDNFGPIGSMFYGVSILYCMTTSLANGGAGLGTMGLPESKLRAMALEAGFDSVRRVPLENPFNNLYEVRG